MNNYYCVRLTLALLLAFTLTASAQERYSGAVTTVADNPSRPLDEVIATQVSAAFSRGDDTVWIGYTMAVRPSMRGSSIRYAEGRNRWVSINRRDDHHDLPGIERVGSERKDLLYLFRKGNPRTPAGIALIDREENLRFTEPLIWLENVSTGRSLKAAMAIADRIGEDDLRGGMMAVIAAHPGEEPPRWFLATVRGGASVETRKEALFWYGYTLDNGDLGELPKLEVELTERELRKQLVFIYHNNESKAALDRLAHIARTDNDPDIAGQAIFWIGNMDEIDPVPVIRSIYNDIRSADVRKKAIFAASRVESDDALDFLTEVARDDTSVEMRKQAIFWIADHDSASAALERLKQIYKADIGFEARKQVLFSASRLDTDEAARFLLEIARTEENRELRKQALFWLSRTESAYADQYFKDVLDK